MRVVLRLAKDSRGGAIVEFALLAPLLLTLLLGGLDFGRLFYARQGLEYATEEAGRYYMLNPSTGQSDITSYLQAQPAKVEQADQQQQDQRQGECHLNDQVAAAVGQDLSRAAEQIAAHSRLYS